MAKNDFKEAASPALESSQSGEVATAPALRQVACNALQTVLDELAQGSIDFVSLGDQCGRAMQLANASDAMLGRLSALRSQLENGTA